ncbi:facilitated trehalose transporter Tret1-like [Colias croceus]|uniref:facilitated trehalose transporter Tret1-like n=1 Tax=Colias crocea TaxID=72248 RepID=UPI001E27C97C|nr:facilitated trehalose transporter Tret1-like [Colias croceus]
MAGLTKKQVLVIIGMLFSNISDGYIYGQLSGMIDALRAPDSPIPVTEEDISWIASILNLMGVCGFALLAITDQFMGRGKSVMFLSTPILATWIMLYYAQSKAVLLISRVIVGTFFGSILTVSYVNIGEYISPDNRSLYTNLVCGAGPILGIMIGHILSILFNWRLVALLGIIPTSISIIFPIFWVESPSWLASKGRFEECRRAFEVLRGSSKEACDEIDTLIIHEKTKQRSFTLQNRHTMLSKLFIAIKHKYFWKIMGLSTVSVIYRVASGRVLFSTFAITLMQEVTGSSNILLFTVAVDMFTISGVLCSCFLIKKLKIRTMILTLGIISNTVLIILAICLCYLPTGNIYFSYMKVLLLASYFIILSAGPYAVLEAIISEIFPLEIKSFCLFLLGVTASPSQFLSIKLAPGMFSSIGYHGVFFLNGGIVYLLLFYMWMYLPETKGRSLQEIESYFRHGSFEVKRSNETAEKLISDHKINP